MKKEEQITIQGKFNLKGVLSLANTNMKQPAILILHGSGPIDRDGNVPKKKIFMNMYKELGDLFASLGFAVLRYDKRGAGESSGDLSRIGLSDLVEDAIAAIHTLKNHPNIDENQIILVGHSEGCTVATAVNEQLPVQGLILLSGAAERLQDALQRQRSIAYEELKKEKGIKGFIINKLNVIEKGEKKAQKLFSKMQNTDKDIIRQDLFVKLPAKYFREMFNYNVLVGLRKVNCPVFAATGSVDTQTNPECLETLKSIVQENVETHVIDGMNHFLKSQEGAITILKAKEEIKAGSNKPVSDELKNVLSEWLRKTYC